MISPRTFGNVAALNEALRARLVTQFNGGAADTGPFCVMLAGGQTPMPIYRAIALHPCPTSPNLHICLSDERFVPWDSPSSNYGNITPLVRALHVPKERLFAVNTTKPLEAAAAQYDTDLSAFIRRGGRCGSAFWGSATMATRRHSSLGRMLIVAAVRWPLLYLARHLPTALV